MAEYGESRFPTKRDPAYEWVPHVWDPNIQPRELFGFETDEPEPTLDDPIQIAAELYRDAQSIFGVEDLEITPDGVLSAVLEFITTRQEAGEGVVDGEAIAWHVFGLGEEGPNFDAVKQYLQQLCETGRGILQVDGDRYQAVASSAEATSPAEEPTAMRVKEVGLMLGAAGRVKMRRLNQGSVSYQVSG